MAPQDPLLQHMWVLLLCLLPTSIEQLRVDGDTSIKNQRHCISQGSNSLAAISGTTSTSSSNSGAASSSIITSGAPPNAKMPQQATRLAQTSKKKTPILFITSPSAIQRASASTSRGSPTLPAGSSGPLGPLRPTHPLSSMNQGPPTGQSSQRMAADASGHPTLERNTSASSSAESTGQLEQQHASAQPPSPALTLSHPPS
ncbi:hypothetical protein BDV98DRAFT_364146 [Pterulicium gracile]|uniref:REJ domain-containing protein n=1 Tax=Pterulicium gracile TaxID=1884261 RepID=A0A5C3QTN1_9AGAR|nr:hypothetical protein BDV98DRAFT_364146 [Pterula gracilis]